MRIERKFTEAGKSPYDAIPFRESASEIRNPDGSVVFSLERLQVPAHWSQVAADILAQKYFRKAGVPLKAKRIEENTVPAWLWRSVPDAEALAALPEAERFGSESDARQVFDRLAGTWTYWGWKGGYFSSEEDARAFYDELRYMLAMQMGAPNSPQWFNTGLYWAYGIDGPEPGSLLCRPRHRRGQSLNLGLRASPAACLLHPVDRRRSRQRGRDHGPLGARGAAVQIWLGHRHQFLQAPGRERAPVGRRQVLRPDELPQDRRPGGGRHQVGRHHAARGQDGRGRHRPPRHRGLHQLEGQRGAEGGGARHRLEGAGRAAQRHPQGLRQLRGRGRRLLRSQAQPGAEARGESRAQGQGAGQFYPPGDPVRPPGLHVDPVPDLRHGLGFGGLSHRLGPELQQFGARHR